LTDPASQAILLSLAITPH
jgi:hypothetical protein